MTSASEVGPAPRALARRLLPFQVAVGLQGMVLWIPVEKLFITQIGFDAASVGVLAAAYAAVVPLLEVPSGIFADRGSRNWVLVGASTALMASSLLGGLSRNVITYVLAAMILGVYFATSNEDVQGIPLLDMTYEDFVCPVWSIDVPGPYSEPRLTVGLTSV